MGSLGRRSLDMRDLCEEWSRDLASEAWPAGGAASLPISAWAALFTCSKTVATAQSCTRCTAGSHHVVRLPSFFPSLLIMYWMSVWMTTSFAEA
jgi:hypothetical protein